jgi:hypothetical protein
MILTESTFLMYAMKHYENPHCSDISEFEEDMKRFQYLRKLFGRYRQENELKERLILNHMIIIYNVFGEQGTPMLFMKLPEYHEYLKPFVEYLNYMPTIIRYDGIGIHQDSINADRHIIQVLKEI